MIKMNTVHISATYIGIQIQRVGGSRKSEIRPSFVTKAAATAVHHECSQKNRCSITLTECEGDK